MDSPKTTRKRGKDEVPATMAQGTGAQAEPTAAAKARTTPVVDGGAATKGSGWGLVYKKSHALQGRRATQFCSNRDALNLKP